MALSMVDLGCESLTGQTTENKIGRYISDEEDYDV